MAKQLQQGFQNCNTYAAGLEDLYAKYEGDEEKCYYFFQMTD